MGRVCFNRRENHRDGSGVVYGRGCIRNRLTPAAGWAAKVRLEPKPPAVAFAFE